MGQGAGVSEIERSVDPPRHDDVARAIVDRHRLRGGERAFAVAPARLEAPSPPNAAAVAIEEPHENRTLADAAGDNPSMTSG